MKKLIVLLLFFGCASAALFALDVSIGGGGQFTADFTSYDLTSDGKENLKDKDPAYINDHFIGGGVYAFLDITYVELNVGLLFGNANRDKLPDDASDEAKKGVDITALKLGLFGKLPIAMGGFTLFPMLGVDGQIFLGGSIGGDAVTEPEDKIGWQDHINQVWFKLGVGADFDLPTESGKLFLRPELLYGLRLNTYTESVDIKAQKDAKTPSYNGIIGHGLDVRVAIGYRF